MWLSCARLVPFFSVMLQLLAGFGEVLSDELFIFGPKYTVKPVGKQVCVILIIFLLVLAKLFFF